MRFLLIVLVGVLVGACASGPTPQQLQTADYGSEISASDAEVMVRSWFDEVLKDAESARYKFSTPTTGWQKPDASVWGDTFFGYRVEVKVNARNSYGGYGGYEDWVFLIHDGRFVAIMHRENGMWIPVFYE